MHLHTFVDRERKRSKNGDDVVVLDVIQITDDQRRTDGTSAFNTRTEQPRLLLLDPARGKERLREMAPAAARRRGIDGAAVLRQGFAKHYGGGGCVGEGEGGTKGVD